MTGKRQKFRHLSTLFTLFIFAFLFYLYYQRVHPLFGDEFNILVQAERVIDGQVPYRDFFQFITPGSIYLSALWLELFGKSIWSIKILSALEGALVFLMVYLLLKNITKSKIVTAIVLLFTLCFCTTFWPFVSHHWISTISALISIYFMTVFIHRRDTILLLSSGFFAGITFVVLQNKGGLIFIALLLFMVIDYLLLSRQSVPDIFVRWKNLFKDGAILFAMFLFPFLVLIVYLFRQDALGDFFYDAFVWVTESYREFNAYPNYFFMGNYSIYKIFTENPFPLNILRIRDLIVIGYLPPFVIGLSIYHFLRILKINVKDISHRERVVVLLTIGGLFMFCSILYRSDNVHITFVFPFVLILIGILFDIYKGLFNSMSRLKKIIFVLMISFFQFYGLYGATSRLRFASNFKYFFDTRIGRFYTCDKGVADFYNSLFRAIDEKITDDYTFVYLWSSFVYFISGKKNPTRYDSIIPGYNTEEQLKEVVEEIKNSGVNYIFYDGIDVVLRTDPFSYSYPLAKINIENPLGYYISENFETIYEAQYDENTTPCKILRRKNYSRNIE